MSENLEQSKSDIEEIELWKKFSKGGIEERLDTTRFELVKNKLRGSFMYTKYDHKKLKALPKEKRVIDVVKFDDIEIELPQREARGMSEQSPKEQLDTANIRMLMSQVRKLKAEKKAMLEMIEDRITSIGSISEADWFVLKEELKKETGHG